MFFCAFIFLYGNLYFSAKKKSKKIIYILERINDTGTINKMGYTFDNGWVRFSKGDPGLIDHLINKYKSTRIIFYIKYIKYIRSLKKKMLLYFFVLIIGLIISSILNEFYFNY